MLDESGSWDGTSACEKSLNSLREKMIILASLVSFDLIYMDE